MAALKNRKHEAFAREVAACTPYATAYREAGYQGDPRWHVYNANRLAHQPAVKARIAELQAEFADRALIHAEYIQRKLLPIVEANVQDLFALVPTPDGKTHEVLRPISAMPRELAAAIRKVKCDAETGAVTEIDLHSKIEAGNVLLRSVGGMVDRVETTGKDGTPLAVINLIRGPES